MIPSEDAKALKQDAERSTACAARPDIYLL